MSSTLHCVWSPAIFCKLPRLCCSRSLILIQEYPTLLFEGLNYFRRNWADGVHFLWRLILHFFAGYHLPNTVPFCLIRCSIVASKHCLCTDGIRYSEQLNCVVVVGLEWIWAAAKVLFFLQHLFSLHWTLWQHSRPIIEDYGVREIIMSTFESQLGVAYCLLHTNSWIVYDFS